MKKILKKIEHENNLYETFKINRLNTFNSSLNNQIFSVDFSFASVILSKKFTRIKKTFALSFETIKYDFKKAFFKQIIKFKLYQHIIKLLFMLNFDQDVIKSDESQNLKKIIISFY